jgi:hypothetical protein
MRAIVLVCALTLCSLGAAQADDIADCNQVRDPHPAPASLLAAHCGDDYSTSIALNPIYALAYNNRAYVYEAQGRNDEAIVDFKSALLLDPSLIGARDGLRRLGAPETLLAQAEARVQQGKSLVEKNCSRVTRLSSAARVQTKRLHLSAAYMRDILVSPSASPSRAVSPHRTTRCRASPCRDPRLIASWPISTA